MGSILQNIESTIKIMDTDVQNREAFEMLICYLAYCASAHLKPYNGCWTSMAYIELPADIINILTKAGYISAITTSTGDFAKPIRRPSVYFTYPAFGVCNRCDAYNNVYAFKMSDEVKDAFYKFCDSEQTKKLTRMLKFLQHIKGYIDNILNEHLKNNF